MASGVAQGYSHMMRSVTNGIEERMRSEAAPRREATARIPAAPSTSARWQTFRGLMPEGAESYAKPFSATCIRQ